MSRAKILTRNEEFNKKLTAYRAYIEDGIIHLNCWCDSTQFFLIEMQQILEMLGCTDIQHETEVDESRDTVYSCHFHVWGKRD